MKILVEVEYLDFVFRDIEKAITFAQMAKDAMVKERGYKEVKITITFCEAEEEDQDD